MKDTACAIMELKKLVVSISLETLGRKLACLGSQAEYWYSKPGETHGPLGISFITPLSVGA